MSTAQRGRLPAYADELDAYHRARRGELCQIIFDLPLVAGQKVLDMGSGDGFYTRWLAARVGWDGAVVGADCSKSYLHVAQPILPAESHEHFVGAAVAKLPFDGGTFDLVWSAHSLVSFPDPVEALSEMRRVVRPGGLVVILENDSMHQVLLPWPAELELAVRRAELRAYREKKEGTLEKYYNGRQLGALMEKAGLVPIHYQTYCSDRRPPLSEDEQEFLKLYFERIRRTTRRFLSPKDQIRLKRMTDPRSAKYLPDQDWFHVTWLDTVCLGCRPMTESIMDCGER